MPDLKHIKLDESVRHIFVKAQRALLPEQIASNSTVLWIFEFDDLLKKNTELIISNEENWVASSYLQEIADLNNDLVTKLETYIPFYFATLIHIGRQWNRAEIGLKDCKAILLKTNLRSSVSHIVEQLRISMGTEIDPSYIQNFLEKMSISATEKHLAMLERAKDWWKLWHIEVERYHYLTTTLTSLLTEVTDQHSVAERRTTYQRILRLKQHLGYLDHSRLLQAMSLDGINFKGEFSSEYIATSPTQSPSENRSPLLHVDHIRSTVRLEKMSAPSHSTLGHYEVVFAVRVDTTDAQIDAIVELTKGYVEKDGLGKVNHIDYWGRRKLSFQVEHEEKEGYFVRFDVLVDPDRTEELNRSLRFTRPILRYTVVRKDE